MRLRWAIVALCLIGVFTLRSDGRGGFGGGGGGRGRDNGAGNPGTSNNLNFVPTLDTAMGEAVWTGTGGGGSGGRPMLISTTSR